MRYSFSRFGFRIGGVALLALGCNGNDILLTTAHANGGDDNAAGATDPGGAGLLGPWKLTADYPPTCTGTECTPQACVANSGYVYCVGGSTDSTFFAEVSATGLGPWMATADYPIPIEYQSCAVDSDRIYCVGGYRLSGGSWFPGAGAYFASLSPKGVDNWAETTAPGEGIVRSCVASAGYIYCLGTSSDAIYYAPLSASGIGGWKTTGRPPTNTAGCVSDGGYIYCFGGGSCNLQDPGGGPAGDPGGDCYSPSYYAPLTAAGIGDWKSTAPLPTSGSARFVNAGSYVYFLSTPTFAARLSPNGISSWETVANYPNGLRPRSCFGTADHIYCSHRATNSSYFAEVGVSDPTAIHLVNPPTGPRSKYLQPAYLHGVGAETPDGDVVAAPTFGKNIDDAIQFDCAADAATPAGCQKTIVSPENTDYNYDLTIWYPCPNAPDTTNCCFQPKLGDDDSLSYAWCASTDTGSFIVTQPIPLGQSG
jgi:hypothetical protein